MPFWRRKREPAGLPADTDTLRKALQNGWNGLPWGTEISGFTAKFPDSAQRDGGWWLTGEGLESFCGIAMHTQYAFNGRGELFMVAFYPEMADRERLPVAALNELGAPDDMSTTWTIGDVEVSVKAAGVAATLTHRRFVDR